MGLADQSDAEALAFEGEAARFLVYDTEVRSQ